MHKPWDAIHKIPGTNPDRGAGLRVLLVEDSSHLTKIMNLVLSRYGYAIELVSNGLEALTAVHTFRPHFVVLDINLPGLDGYQIAELIHADSSLNNVVLIALSGYGPEAHPDRFRRAKFDHHIQKPVLIEEFLPLLVLPPK